MQMQPPNPNKQRVIHRRLRGGTGNNIDFEFRYRSRSKSLNYTNLLLAINITSATEPLLGLGVIQAPSSAPASRSPSPLSFFTPEPEVRPRGIPKRKRDIDETDGNGDIVMKPIEWKLARTGEMLEVIDLTQD